MSRLAQIAFVLAAAASFACSSNPPGADGGSGTTSSGGTGAASTTGGGSSGGTTGTASGGSSTGGASSTGGTTGSVTDGGIPFGQFEGAYAAAVCQAEAACQPMAAYFQAGCAANFENSGFAAGLQQAAADIDAGFAGYDPAAAAACVQAVSQAGCGLAVGPEPVPCLETLVGQIPVGASCYDNFDCDAGYCSSPTSTCPGSCTAFLAQGADCSDGGLCAPPAECVPQADDGGHVAAVLCEALGQVGASCGPNRACAYPLACVNGACAAAGAAGAACAASFGLPTCQGGLYCQSFDGGAATACVAQVAQGGACGQDVSSAAVAELPAGEGGQCAAGLACTGFAFPFMSAVTVPGICQPFSDVGGPCAFATDAGFPSVTGCLYGLACVSGTCQLPPTSGPCTSDPNYPCNPFGDYCDPTSQTCKPLLPAGAACNGNPGGRTECATGYCDSTGHCPSGLPTCLAP